MRAGIVAAIGIGCLLAPEARAGDYDEEPFSLRLPSALSRFSRYPDVAGVGGASAAAIWGSAPNPAGTAWLDYEGGSAQYSRIAFDAGTRVGVSSASWSFAIDGLGTFQPSIAQAWSNRAETRQGSTFGIDATFGEIQWGRKVAEATAVGLNLFASASETTFGAGGRTVARGRSEGAGARAGVLHQASEAIRLGVAVEYGVTSDRTRLTPAPGTARRAHDATGQFALQPGLSWEYGKSRRVYLDYRYGALHNGEGTLRVHRFLAGIDHEFVPYLNGRAGLGMDARGHASPALGIGIYPSERVFLDLSWQRNQFPEVEREFGRSWTIGVALSVLF